MRVLSVPDGFGMGQNFLPCDRDQELLLREWLPEDHLAWFVLETVAALHLERSYRWLGAAWESFRFFGPTRSALHRRTTWLA
jgi:hypothetical protein